MRDIRHVIVHTPGPLWKVGVPIFQQEGADGLRCLLAVPGTFLPKPFD